MPYLSDIFGRNWCSEWRLIKEKKKDIGRMLSRFGTVLATPWRPVYFFCHSYIPKMLKLLNLVPMLRECRGWEAGWEKGG